MGRKPLDPTRVVLQELYKNISPGIHIKNITLDLKRVRHIRLYFLYDVHYGASTCFKQVVEDVVKKIRNDPYAYLILGGDLAEFINIKDKRFNPDDVDPELLQDEDNIVGAEVDKIYEWFKPVADKILMVLTGNHELAIAKYNGTNPTKVWVKRWNSFIKETINKQDKRTKKANVSGIIDGGYESILLLKVNNNPKTSVGLYLSHGWGGGRLMGAKANRIMEMMYDFPNASLFVSGHSHAPLIFPKLTHIIDSINNRLDADIKWFVRAPALKLGRGHSKTQYEKVGGYHTSPVGYIIVDIKIDGDNKPVLEPRLKVEYYDE